MEGNGAKTKGAVAGVGIVAALSGGLARVSDDLALAGCRATRTATMAGEGVAVGRFAKGGVNLADDGLRGIGRTGLGHVDDAVPRGRPWMIGAAEGDDGLRLGAGSQLDDLATHRGASVRDVSNVATHGSSPGETAAEFSVDMLDLATDGMGAVGTEDKEFAPRRRAHLSILAQAPRGVLIQTWPNEMDGSAGVPMQPIVTRVEGAAVRKHGWRAVLSALPHANPLVVFGTSIDQGRTLQLDDGHGLDVADLHAACTTAGLKGPPIYRLSQRRPSIRPTAKARRRRNTVVFQA